MDRRSLGNLKRVEVLGFCHECGTWEGKRLKLDYDLDEGKDVVRNRIWTRSWQRWTVLLRGGSRLIVVTEKVVQTWFRSEGYSMRVCLLLRLPI